MSEYGVTDKGFVKKRYDTIYEELQNDIKDGLGIDIASIEHKKIERLADRLASHEPCPICGPFNEYCSEEFDAYVPVSSEGDIMERDAGPGEEWVYHAKYCPNCGRKLS